MGWSGFYLLPRDGRGHSAVETETEPPGPNVAALVTQSSRTCFDLAPWPPWGQTRLK